MHRDSRRKCLFIMSLSVHKFGLTIKDVRKLIRQSHTEEKGRFVPIIFSRINNLGDQKKCILGLGALKILYAPDKRNNKSC